MADYMETIEHLKQLFALQTPYQYTIADTQPGVIGAYDKQVEPESPLNQCSMPSRPPTDHAPDCIAAHGYEMSCTEAMLQVRKAQYAAAAQAHNHAIKGYAPGEADPVKVPEGTRFQDYVRIFSDLDELLAFLANEK